MKFRLNKPAVIAFTVIAVASCLYLFAYSMLPYKKPPKLLTVDVSQLKPGEMLTHATPDMIYFVIRGADGKPYTLAVPMIEDSLHLPDQYWWKPSYVCHDFALETTEGMVTDKSIFHCRDADLPSEAAKRWQWDSHGRHVGNTSEGRVDDMYRVNFKQSGDEITFTGLASN